MTLLVLALASPTARAEADAFAFDLWARPSREIGVADLGAIYDASFHRVASPPRDAARVWVSGERRSGAGLRVLDGPMELAAHHGIWAVPAGSDPMSFSVYRAYEIERTFELDEPPPAARFPRGGGWYVSAVALGRMVEVLFPGQRLGTSDAGRPLHRGDARGRAAFVSRIALRPRVPGGRPPLVDEYADLSSTFVPVGPARPIFVRWRWRGPDRDDLPLVATVVVEDFTAPPVRAITERRGAACRWVEGPLQGVGEPWDPADGPDLSFVVLRGPPGHREPFFVASSSDLTAGAAPRVPRWTFGGWPGPYVLQLVDADSAQQGDVELAGCRSARSASDPGTDEVVGHWEFLSRSLVIETMSRGDQRVVLRDEGSGASVTLSLRSWRP